MKKVLLTLGMAIGLTSLAYAGDTSGSTTLTATAQPGCSIQNSPSLSLAYSGLGDATGNFQLQIECDNGLNYTITFGDGNNASGGVRRATDGNGNYLAYRLYQDSGYTTEIGVGSNNTMTGTGDGNTQNITIYAKVPQSENASNNALGTYTDTLNITISW
ncbi:spore coat U domain-containing protein [Venenivibrio stagnispumantis]|uniref:Spore coat protein U (SCPU) domain-containing protein n=1 Tax=Venenivibrio stagnispumantis TaxID=407998 RepID=A0AA45WPT9_9AQUI|nr:spore coat protein U domain-containing protein [Venenivibrio stagnispumantis]MCW4573994.1 spore coat protein U domain-containing protein [Venenivibrio stagnispumantis]SMP21109.1 Spore coat protein U (SCPU) domain-containing protein [Venenivibrio stagnispumantis]